MSRSIKIYLCLYCIGLLSAIELEGGMYLERNPRYFPFPRGIGNKLQVIVGFGIPVPDILDDVTYGLIIKSNYALPTNSNQFSQPEVAFATDDTRQINRWSLYALLEGALERISLDGKTCMLKSICQASFTEFSHYGLLGEIIKTILLPSTTSDSDEVKNEYHESEEIGQKSVTEEVCDAAFPKCATSLIDLVSVIDSTYLGPLIRKYS